MEFTTIAKARKQTGLSYLGNINSSAKMIKNKKVSNNYTYVIYLAPAKQSGYNVCPYSTPECRKGCLNTSGRAGMEITAGKLKTQNCRNKKTVLLHEETEFFMAWMIAEMQYFQRKAKKDGYAFSARLNGTSDIDWQSVKVNGKSIFEIFPDVQFYDYTKNINKYIDRPSNYYITYSHTGRNWSLCEAVLKEGFNVAVVFNTGKKEPLPLTYKGYPVINGDLTDYRPFDDKGVIVGLRWKHIADKQVEKDILNSVFVVDKQHSDCMYTSNVQETSEANVLV